MICAYICQDLYKQILKGDFKGIIHSVFFSSLNIIGEDQNFITFLNSEKAMTPNSIKLDTNISFKNLGFESGFQIKFFKKFAEIEDLDIKIDYSKSSLWDRNPNLIFERDSNINTLLKLKKMGQFLSQKGNKAGIYPLLKTINYKIEGLDLLIDNNIVERIEDSFIQYRFSNFIDDYAKENVVDIGSSAKKIIGYGIGLTPYMDDFISGMMVSRIYISYYLEKDLEYACELNNSIIKEIKNKTTIVSEEMLKYSSLGQVNEYIKDLMVSFLGNFPIKDFEDNLEKVISIGETSGTDILLGIYMGSCILLDSF